MKLSADDRAALHDLVHRYAAGIDDRDFQSVVDLFAPDAVLLLPDPPAVLEPEQRHVGRAAIGEAVAAVASTLRTQHAIVGEVFDDGPGADAACGRITGVAHHWVHHDGRLRDVVWHLRYHDEYRRTPDRRWRIHSRALTVDAVLSRAVDVVRGAFD